MCGGFAGSSLVDCSDCLELLIHLGFLIWLPIFAL